MNATATNPSAPRRHSMRRQHLPMPGLLWGDYPERRPMPQGINARLGKTLRAFNGRLGDALSMWLSMWRAHQDAAWLHSLRHCVLPADTEVALQDTRSLLLRQALSPQALAQALALVSRVAEHSLGLRPFDTQLLAARAVLQNSLAEMATGEGKTLAVALAAAVGALAGMPVHVVTANDYLVARDAQHLAPLYSALGLSVGFVVQPDAAAARARAYACSITYVSAKELVFDYLRDGLQEGSQPGSQPGPQAGSRGAAFGRLSGRRSEAPAAPLARLQNTAATTPPALLRGLCMAIVDEADAVLIDEARVPLILSQATPEAESQAHAQQALQFAAGLQWDLDFKLNAMALTAHLTDAGRARLQAAACDLLNGSATTEADAAWRHPQHREHAVCMALVALHGLQRDKHYLVREVKAQAPVQAQAQGPAQSQFQVQIIDAGTGRVAEGRAWSQGLQQLVEIKEGCATSPSLSTLAQLTFQRFFARYLRLGGLSGTLCEARTELMAHYNTPICRVPLRRPSQRRVLPTRLFKDANCLWQAVATEVLVLQRSQRPVLIATDSVADAQTLAALLLQQLPSAAAQQLQCLTARNDADEARLVAQAGQRGAITVTTNMAGRGTDIELGPGVAGLGGLHVICCQLNSARRIDRQLAGRAARQGDPGSVQTLLSLDNALLRQGLPAFVRARLQTVAQQLPSWAVKALARWPQWAEEQNQQLQRQRLMAADERTERQLSFGAAFE
jgi:preprotein translocase subunit SecA